MAVQTKYRQPRAGVAGLLYDVSYSDAVARTGADDDGALQYGYGVVRGDSPGSNVVLPSGTSTVKDFEGVVLRGGPVERQFMTDETVIFKGTTLSVLQRGKVWVQLADGEAPAYGKQVFLLSDGTFATVGGIALNAEFLGINDGSIGVAKFNDRPVA